MNWARLPLIYRLPMTLQRHKQTRLINICSFRACNTIRSSPIGLSKLLMSIALLWGPTTVYAQAEAQAQVANDTGISLNFPENLELKILAEYVSGRLGMNILYDEQIGNRRVTIKAPARIPESSLIGLFESALQMKGLALVDAEQPGWKRIAQATNLIAIAVGPKEVQRLTEEGKAGPSLAVTQVFTLKHADTKRAEQIIKPFLTQPGGNSIGITENGLVIVTDYATNMRRITGLIELVDQPGAEIIIEFVPVTYQEAAALAPQALKLIRAKLNAELRQQGSRGAATTGLDVTHDEHTNQVVVVGTQDRIIDAIDIVRSLDVSLGLETRVYQFENASPERIDRLTQELVGPLTAKRLYRSAVDQEAGILVVATTQAVHEKIMSLKRDLDVPASESQSPIRFYKLTNATAADVLETIRSLEGDQGLSFDQTANGRTPQPSASGAASPPDSPGQPPSRLFGNQNDTDDSLTSPLQPVRSTSIQGVRATLTADTNTNTIIVVAPPQEQQMYERLIRTLDRRRPQVMIEVTIVILDTTDNFSLGVEISHAHSAGEADTITFGSFGLSAVDAVTGGLSLIPGLGFNGAIIAPDIADIVIKALKTDVHSRVVSSPRILVNDNATGTLESIAEEPFTSVNASDTVSTTSFGGYAEAGTTITVTPHISEGEHLSLEYSISLNSFSGAGSDGIPPPRNTNSVQSEVTVLNGHTLIVGGLNRTDYSNTVNAIPILGQIPILKYLFSSESDTKAEGTLFVFIRPVILRDDQFEDLKFLSTRQLKAAGLPPEFPTSEPMLIY